jgi:hypothetical protein
VRTIGSHYQHSNPSVHTRPGAPFTLVRHAWRSDRRAYTLPRHLDCVSRPARVRRGTWTAGPSSRYPISKGCLHAGCATSSTPCPTLANPETLGLSPDISSDVFFNVHVISVHIRKPVMLYGPGLAVHLHISAGFCSGCQWLYDHYSLLSGIATPEDLALFHNLDLLAFRIFI